MFSDASVAPVGFSTCWRREKHTLDSHTQTSELLTYDVESQTTTSSSVGIQTDIEPARPQPLVVDNSRELQNFMKKVEPMVARQLQMNIESHAFDGYEVHWEEENTAVSCLHTLTEASLNYELHCTDLAWNCTGSVLAVSYGQFDHQDWCSHKSMLCTWNIDRRSIDSRKADVTVDVPSCCMCIAFHPELPAVIAGGTFSGEVRVWNTGEEGDPLVASSGFSELGHKEPVASISWLLTQEHRKYRHLLVTLGNGGKVLVWELLYSRHELPLVQGLRLLTSSIPAGLRISRAKTDAQIGGTCLSFSREDSTQFVVGSENGGLFKCFLPSLDSTRVDEHTVETEFPCPIRFSFRPHQGPVYAVACSPFHRNLFLSSSTDGTARLHSMLDSTAVLSVEPACGYLFSLRWSPSRPLVFSMATGDGKVLLYDLRVSHISPVLSLEASPHRRAVSSLEYNHKRHHLLASGDASGIVKVWRLSSELTQHKTGELDQLNSIALEALSVATL